MVWPDRVRLQHHYHPTAGSFSKLNVNSNSIVDHDQMCKWSNEHKYVPSKFGEESQILIFGELLGQATFPEGVLSIALLWQSAGGRNRRQTAHVMRSNGGHHGNTADIDPPQIGEMPTASNGNQLFYINLKYSCTYQITANLYFTLIYLFIYMYIFVYIRITHPQVIQ